MYSRARVPRTTAEVLLPLNAKGEPVMVRLYRGHPTMPVIESAEYAHSPGSVLSVRLLGYVSRDQIPNVFYAFGNYDMAQIHQHPTFLIHVMNEIRTELHYTMTNIDPAVDRVPEHLRQTVEENWEWCVFPADIAPSLAVGGNDVPDADGIEEV